MTLLSGFTNSGIFVIFGLYLIINTIILLILKATIGNWIRVNNKILYWIVLFLLSIIVTFSLLNLVTSITGRGLLE